MEHTKEQFLALQTREDVAELLGVNEKSLRYFLYVLKPENMYHEFTIEKKSGGQRTICAPDKKLKAIQRKLANVLNCVYKIKSSAHGFVYGKDIVTNAKNHTKRRYVLNLDLENFFDQINFGRVRGMLLKPPYGIGEEAATVIAQIACYKGKLPQGAPSSPILSNMICAPLDTQLTKVAMKHKLQYSRYADDITLSSFREEIPQGIAIVSSEGVIVGKEIVEVINRNGFSINDSKSRIFDCHRRQEVTGLIVNKFVNIKRSYVKEIRAILNHCQRANIYEAAKEYIQKGKCNNANIAQLLDDETEESIQKIEEWFIRVLKGKIEYIRHVKGSNHLVFIKYAKEFNELCENNIFNIEGQIELLEKIEKSVFILESTSNANCVQGSGFILKDVGLLTNYHVTEDGEIYKVKTFKEKEVLGISNEINLIKGNKEIDYASYNFGATSQDALDLGNSSSIRIGSHVILVGYPDYAKGNSPDIQRVEVTSTRIFMGQTIYTVSGKVIHGASGGAVLDEDYKVVGIIRCGVAKMEESSENAIQGFVLIEEVLKDMRK